MNELDDIDALAAEYVLGTLSRAERSKADALRARDAAFAAAVLAWERRLGPLADVVTPIEPPAASHPPTGATAIASPRNACVYDVYRFASEYQNTIARATGDNNPHVRFNCHDAATNTIDETITKMVASRLLRTPRGISRIAVRGLSASIRASTRRLNPIAALRAETIATITQRI